MNITGFIEHLALQPMMKNKQPQEPGPENDSLPATSKQKGMSPYSICSGSYSWNMGKVASSTSCL
jgi:hypothetical protein